MQSLFEAGARAQQVLLGKRIRSVAIGGVALAVWGRARATKDVDLKVALMREDATALLDALSPEYEVLTKNGREALERVGFIFVRDRAGVRLDFLLSDNEFDEAVLVRAVEVDPEAGVRLRVCTAEDLVIYKLVAARAHDIVDAQAVVMRQADRLDVNYIQGWLAQFEEALADSTLIQTFRRLSSSSD